MALTVENIRVIMEELLMGYALIKRSELWMGYGLIKRSELLEPTEEESEYSEEEYSEEQEEHARKLKRIEETLWALEEQVNRIALMQEKRLNWTKV